MRKEKKLLLNEIKEEIKNSTSIIIAENKGITPKNSWDLSKILASNGGKFKIFKKRIFIKAIKECAVELNIKNLKGHIGALFIKKDALSCIKPFVEFCTNSEKTLQPILGIIENKHYSKEEIVRISKLPGEKELKAQFLSVLQAPMAQTLSVMNNVLTSIIFCIKSKQEKSEV